MNRVRMLIHFGVIPYLVFDGANLPSKAGTETDRETRRAESCARGKELLRLGKSAQAHKEFQKAVDVTPEMAGALIQELKRSGVKYVVAPYEADSQLAYLERKGIIDGIITEDSDLLVFGARVLLTKLDQYGECIMIRRDDFTSCREISLIGWSDQDFRRMAILSGCDYLPNIGGLGLMTAYRLLRKHKTLERVLQAVRLEGKMKIPADYHQLFIQAEMTFLYQWAYCPTAQGLVNLTSLEPGVVISDMPFIGECVEAAIASGVARGELHPQSKQPLILPTNRNTPGKPKHPQLRKQEQENSLSKKGVSIAEFFKPKRVPLAELEPNAFILTPRQQELARNAATSSWSSPIVRPSVQADRENTPHSAPAAARRPLGIANHETPSLNRTKRQRLCHDDLPDLPGVSMNSTSKFFSRPDMRKKKPISSDFDIHSDDSVEEVFLSMPEPAIGKSTSGNTDLPETKPTVSPANAATKDDSQLTLLGIHTPTRETAFDEVEDTFVEDLSSVGQFDKYLLDDLATLKNQIVTTAASTIKISTSVSISKVLIEDQQSPCLVPGSPISHPLDDGIPDFAWDEADMTIVVPGSDIAEPPTSPVKYRKLDDIVIQGSEDLLASDSEVSDVDDERRKIRTLNLRRFAFTS